MKRLLECFTKNQFQKKKTNQKGFRVEKVIKKKGDKLYLNWKSNDNSFNNQIDKKYVVYIDE